MTTTKKVAAKKAVAKKSTTKSKTKTGKHKLICAEGEQCFWTTNGIIVADLIGLRDLLHSISDEVFHHHVTKDRNDFADWVKAILKDAELAAALRRAKQPKTAYTVVVRRLKVYEV